MSDLKQEKAKLEDLKQRHSNVNARLVARQEAYEKAKAKHLPTAEKLKNARDRTAARLKVVDKNLAAEKKAVDALVKAKKQTPLPPRPDLTKIGNHSSRYGVKPRIIVFHITVSHNRPGNSDVQGILDYFTQVEASSHRVIDFEGFVGVSVNDVDKAWTQAAYNPQALSIEIISYTDLPSDTEWHKQAGKGLEKIAHQVAYWSWKYGIPLTHSITNGCCQHRNLGVAGGGHTDVGDNFPEKWVLERAKAIKKSWGV